MADNTEQEHEQLLKHASTLKAELKSEKEVAAMQAEENRKLKVKLKEASENLVPPESAAELDDPEVFVDPYNTQNPHQIIAHPPGLRLGWINPVYRERRGWRGWDPVQYDDRIGKSLEKWIPDPPRKMDKAMDNMVRRGDVILCKIKEEFYLARQNARTDKAAKRAGEHAGALQNDSRPLMTQEDAQSMMRK